MFTRLIMFGLVILARDLSCMVTDDVLRPEDAPQVLSASPEKALMVSLAEIEREEKELKSALEINRNELNTSLEDDKNLGLWIAFLTERVRLLQKNREVCQSFLEKSDHLKTILLSQRDALSRKAHDAQEGHDEVLWHGISGDIKAMNAQIEALENNRQKSISWIAVDLEDALLCKKELEIVTNQLQMLEMSFGLK